MLLDIVKPIALMLCILSLYVVFHTAFLVPASDLPQKISDSLELLALATGISLTSGMIFRESISNPSTNSARLSATLPMQIFFWAVAAMIILFIASWYLENNCIFYRDVRFR
jgi:hypothetical protein